MVIRSLANMLMWCYINWGVRAALGTKPYEYYKKMVKKNGLKLEKTPKKFKTKELCLMAVKKNGHALRWVPDELKNRRIMFNRCKTNLVGFTMGS